VTGGVYNSIRHPQYVAFASCSLGLLLLWSRYIVLILYIAVLFAYYLLAKVEERECEEKFGQSYIDYRNKTHMFLPFRIPFADRLPGLPRGGLKRYGAILGLYAVIVVAAMGFAFGVREFALNSLYAAYTPNAAFVSLSQIEPAELDHIIAIAQADAQVQARLAQVGQPTNARFINYVLPTTWYAAEIPMQSVAGARGHYAPAEYDRNLYKIVFTRIDLRGDPNVQGKDLLRNVAKRMPVVEVRVDLAQQQVVRIDNPPGHINYENIPVAIY
jgi:hypothetical protein